MVTKILATEGASRTVTLHTAWSVLFHEVGGGGGGIHPLTSITPLFRQRDMNELEGGGFVCCYVSLCIFASARWRGGDKRQTSIQSTESKWIVHRVSAGRRFGRGGVWVYSSHA